MSEQEVTAVLDVREKSAPSEHIRTEMKNPILGLAEIFPHVARRIASFWGTTQLHEYLTGLTMMDRTDRAGFPPDAMNYLLDIWRHTDDSGLPDDQAHCQWVNDVRLMKAFKQDDIERSNGFGSRLILSGSDAALLDMAQILSSVAAKA